MTGVNSQSFSRLQVAHDEFTGEFEPGRSLAAELLQQEAVATENARSERLLEADRNLNLRGRAQKAVAMNHVFVSRRDFDRHDVAGQFGGKGQLTTRTDGPIFRH